MRGECRLTDNRTCLDILIWQSHERFLVSRAGWCQRDDTAPWSAAGFVPARVPSLHVRPPHAGPILSLAQSRTRHRGSFNVCAFVWTRTCSVWWHAELPVVVASACRCLLRLRQSMHPGFNQTLPLTRSSSLASTLRHAAAGCWARRRSWRRRCPATSRSAPPTSRLRSGSSA